MFSRRDFTLGALGAGAVAVVGLPRAGAASPIRGRLAAETMQTLASYPYVPVGTGAPVYVFVSQSCVNCHAFLRDYPQGVPGIQLRFIVQTLVSEDEFQLTRLLVQRTPKAFSDYMNDRTSRSPRGVTNAMTEVYNRTTATSAHLSELCRASQGSRLGTPAFVFMPRRNPQGAVQYLPGYTPSYITDIILPTMT
jgi:hypothetical protein